VTRSRLNRHMTMLLRSAIPALLPVTLLLALSPAFSACTKDKKGDPVQEGAEPTANAQEAAKTPATRKPLRASLHPIRPLIAESARAELHAQGLFVDLGTADQHKFTRGGWGTGWQDGKTDSQANGKTKPNRTNETFASVSETGATLDVALIEPANAVVVRARSAVEGQKLTVYFNGKAIKTVPVAASWSELRIPLGEAAQAGPHGLRLVFAKPGAPRADIDWVWLPADNAKAPPLVVPRVIPLKVSGAPRRALVAPTPRTYAFFLEPPQNAKLVVDTISDVGAEFTATVTSDQGQEQLFSVSGGPKWVEAVGDLSDFAGQAIRLELTTTGGAGVSGWGEPEIMLTKPARAVAQEGAPAKNLIFLLIDTARADVFAPFDPDNAVKTDNFDALAERGLAFTAAYNNENWTKPSVATSLTGLYPSTHNTKTDGASLPDDVEMASQRFKKNRFATAGFVANGYVSEKFGFEKGWDHFRNYIRERKNTEAKNVFGDALTWLKELKASKPKQRFFLYIQTIDPHVPYRVDEEFLNLYFEGRPTGKLRGSVTAEDQIDLHKKAEDYTNADRAYLRSMYRAEVSYHDHYMGQFFSSVEEMGLFDSTAIVVTNDHGEELGDHDRYGHGHSLYEELLRAPLILKYDPVFKPGTWPGVVEHVDLMPTMMDTLGLPPWQQADGLSLLPKLRAEPVQQPAYAISEFGTGRRSIRVGRYKLMRSTGTFRHLFDIEADPDETIDLWSERPIARRLCEVHLGEGLAQPKKAQRLLEGKSRRRFNAQSADIDPELRKQLEALGYFGGN